jgi:hypothetical protein
MKPKPWDGIEQPPDDAVAGSPWFFVDTYIEFQKGLAALLSELESHRNAVQLLGLESSPYDEEVAHIRLMVDWGKERLDGTKVSPRDSITVNGVTFSSLRYLKAGILYLAYLIEKQKRGFLAGAEIVPRSVLRSFDARIEQLQNMGEMGKLGGLRPAEVLLELFEATDSTSCKPEARMEPSFPTSITHADVLIVDPVLRKRCLPILAAIEGSGSPERYDTVIREMSVVLEDRVRQLTGFAGKVSGAELFNATMNRDPCLIKFSSEKSVQEAAHLFFRGYSGLVRNEVMHRLVESYTKERVMQLLGTIDYLLFLLSRAEVQRANGTS